MAIHALKDLDIFYLSFDEANSEANWKRVQSQHAIAKRIHGVVGLDKAHKACALASTTRRFVTIDGDNWLNDGTIDLVIDDTDLEDACFSFKSKNYINGLEYGNGGLKVWDKTTLLSTSTHESSDGTDFCWDIRYFQVDTIGSTTVTNGSPYQAWRAGYREGIKMSYINGKPVHDFKNNWKNIWQGNLSRLAIWCSVGRDVKNGMWSMLGARQGLFELITHMIDHRSINDYLWFRDHFAKISEKDTEELLRYYADRLLNDFGFMIPELDSDSSAWIKLIYMNPTREGLMR